MSYTAWSVVFGEQPSAAKWNILGTNDASFNDGTGIGNAAIKPVHLATGLSSSTWAWQTYSPTLTGLSGGTTNWAKYMQIGKTVFVSFKYTLAGAGVSGATGITLPVTATSDYAALAGAENGEMLQSTVAFIDAAVNYYGGFVAAYSTTAVRFRYHNTSANLVATSSTVPHTWGTGDFIVARFCYEAA